MNDDTHAETEEMIELAHPFRVTLGQVVVDGDNVHAASAEGIQVDRESGDQGFSFASFHFGDLPLVQNHAADQLHVEVAHVEHAPAGLAHHREGLHQQFFQCFFKCLIALGFNLLNALGIGLGLVLNMTQPLLNAAAELFGLGAELSVRQLLNLRLKSVDGLDLRHQPLEFTLVLGPEDLRYYSVDQSLFLGGRHSSRLQKTVLKKPSILDAGGVRK